MTAKPTEEGSFLGWLEDWYDALPTLDFAELAADPPDVALVSEDLVKGFCDEGPLASDRAARIVPAVIRLFERARELGVRHFLLFQDTHEPGAAEFAAYPPHCLEGTEESETIDELRDLPFSDLFTILPKNSISSSVGTGLEAWFGDHSDVNTFIVVGVCTDICVYQAAMHLRVRANVLDQRGARVIVPADCVETFDTPVELALEFGAMPHDGDLLHRIFLYHMALNGIEIVQKVVGPATPC